MCQSYHHSIAIPSILYRHSLLYLRRCTCQSYHRCTVIHWARWARQTSSSSTTTIQLPTARRIGQAHPTSSNLTTVGTLHTATTYAHRRISSSTRQRRRLSRAPTFAQWRIASLTQRRRYPSKITTCALRQIVSSTQQCRYQSRTLTPSLKMSPATSSSIVISSKDPTWRYGRGV